MPQPMRAYWKGHLRLSLVSIAVEVFPATQTRKGLALHQLDRESGQRVRYEKTAEGEKVEAAGIVRGADMGDGTYVVIEPEELDAIKLESKKTIELVQFVDQSELDPRYYEKPYYVVPDGEVAGEGYAVIREALRQKKRVGLGRLTLRGRESLVAIKPCGRGLLMETLRYADEVRKSDSVFDAVPEATPEAEMVQLAAELIARKSAPFDAAAFHDTYADALRALIERKRQGKAIVTGVDEERRPSGQVIDLMAALRRSVQSQAPAAANDSAADDAPAKRSKAPPAPKAKKPAQGGRRQEQAPRSGPKRRARG